MTPITLTRDVPKEPGMYIVQQNGRTACVDVVESGGQLFGVNSKGGHCPLPSNALWSARLEIVKEPTP